MPGIWRRLAAAFFPNSYPGGDPTAGPMGVGTSFPGLEAGANRRRMSVFAPVSEHVNTLLANAGATSVARARWLVRNNGYARAALRSWSTATVGAGIKPSPSVIEPALKSAITLAWADWTDQADAENLTDFYGIALRVAREVYLAGECFVHILPRPSGIGLLVPLQLLLLPAEQLPLWKNEQAPNGNAIRLGVEFNPLGERVAYWFWRRHPGDAPLGFASALASDELQRIPADEILHVFDPTEAGQVRGLSSFSAAIVKLFLMDIYDDAELERKKQAARFAAFIKKPAIDWSNPDHVRAAAEAAAGDSSDGAISYYGPGAVLELHDGEDLTFSEPADVGPNYEGFQYRTLLQISAALGVPYTELSHDLTKASYASSRAGTLSFWGNVEAHQYAVLVYQFLRPIYHRWMQAAVIAGAVPITAARYNRERTTLTRFRAITPKKPWVDPMKDLAAEALAVQNGFKSRSDVIEAQGFDPDETDQRIAEDRARERLLGLDFTPVTRLASGPRQSMPGVDSTSGGSESGQPDDAQQRGDAA